MVVQYKLDSMVKKLMKGLFPIAFSIAVLSIIYRKITWTDLVEIVKSSDPLLVIIFILLFVPQFFIAGLRYQNQLVLLGEKKLSSLFLSSVIYGSFTVNLFLPGKLGETIRIFWLSREIAKSSGLKALVWEKFLDIKTIIFFFILGSALTYNNEDHFKINLLLSALASPFLFFSSKHFFKLLLPILRLIKPNLKFSVDQFPRANATTLLSSWAYWLLQFLQMFVVFLIYKKKVAAGTYLVSMASALVFGILPISFMGIGARDLPLNFYLEKSFSKEFIFSLAIFASLRVLITGLIGVYFFLRLNKNIDFKEVISTLKSKKEV
jgi:hypothetical protein